jgi:hypothetical protein
MMEVESWLLLLKMSEPFLYAEDAVSFFRITYLCCTSQIFTADAYFLLDL